MRIPQGCADALRRIRKIASTRTLWIDAVCIDQDNVVERNSQVERMPSIYANAAQVLACVGESDDDSTWLFAQTKKWDGVSAPERLSRRAFRDIGAGYREKLEAFLGRPWFRRIWIVQEIALARDITMICGLDEAAWDEFHDLLERWGVDESLVEYFPAVLRTRRNVRSGSLNNISTLSLLQAVRGCLASDDRDKLFAVRGLLHKREGAPKVRYDLSAEEVFEQFARQHIESTRTLDILSYAQQAINGSSWIPDWRVIAHRGIIADNVALSEDSLGFCAGGQVPFSTCTADPLLNSRCLEVQAVVLASITVRSKDKNLLKSPVKIRSRIRESEEKWKARKARTPLGPRDTGRSGAAFRIDPSACANKYAGSSKENESRGRDQIRINQEHFACRCTNTCALPHGFNSGFVPAPRRHELCRVKLAARQLSRRSNKLLIRRWAGRFKEREVPQRAPPLETVSEARCRAMRAFAPQSFVHSPTQMFRHAQLSDNLNDSIRIEALEGRTLAWLPGIGCALVPEETRVGDIVCVLLGASTPFVLRPRGKSCLYPALTVNSIRS